MALQKAPTYIAHFLDNTSEKYLQFFFGRRMLFPGGYQGVQKTMVDGKQA
jgi:hypothetical protein